jgi:hypothetical protein
VVNEGSHQAESRRDTGGEEIACSVSRPQENTEGSLDRRHFVRTGGPGLRVTKYRLRRRAPDRNGEEKTISVADGALERR